MHGSSIGNPQSALYKVSKVPPYGASHSPFDFEPHLSMTFLNAITQLEEKLAKKKLIAQDAWHYGLDNLDDPGKRKRDDVEGEGFTRESGVHKSEERELIEEEGGSEERIVMHTGDYSLRQSSLTSQEKAEFIKQLERQGKHEVDKRLFRDI